MGAYKAGVAVEPEIDILLISTGRLLREMNTPLTIVITPVPVLLILRKVCVVPVAVIVCAPAGLKLRAAKVLLPVMVEVSPVRLTVG